MADTIRFLARQPVGPYVGVVRGGGTAEAHALEVVLQDADGCQQRLGLPLDGLAVLRDVLRQAVRRLDDAGQDPARLAAARQRGNRRGLARTGVDRLGELFALGMVNGAVISGELRVLRNDDVDQELVVAMDALDALVALAEDAALALTGAAAEQAGVIGRC